MILAPILVLCISGLVSLVCTRIPRLSRLLAGWGGVIGGLLLVFTGYAAMHQPAQDKVFSLPYFLVLGEGSIHLDAFSGIFLIILGWVAAAASVYGLGYAKLYVGQHSMGWLGAMTNWFIASMVVVLVASHAITFLFAWEIMALTSFALVVYQHSQEKARQAGFIYAIMTHLGTACLCIAFIIFSQQSGSLAFASWNGVGGLLTPALATCSFVLLLIGFGTKAGLVPLHMWLPEAHPQAPSHISALMSGVMLKIAVYAFFRVFGISLVDVAAPWWGLLVMLIGGISALVGVFYAIERRDIKKALAFSSIENIGIIFIGIGASMYFLATDQPGFAFVAAIAALLHAVNHSILKSLLFLGAGSVYYSFHTRSMDWLGGVAKVLPVTSMVFLLGAIGVMGLPPLNAFASEWLTLQTLLNGIASGGVGLGFVFSVVLAAFALAAGLAFVVFTRMFGIVFLGLNRKPEDAHHVDSHTPWSINCSLVVLGLTAIGISIFMPQVIQGLQHSFPSEWFTSQVVESAEFTGLRDVLSIPVSTSENGVRFGNTIWVVLAVCVGLMAIVGGIIRLWGGKKRIVSGPSWDCGVPLNERMQYSGLGFTSPIRHALRYFLRPQETVKVTQGQDNFYFWRVRSYSVQTLAFFDDFIVRPVAQFFKRLGNSMKKVQAGHISVYLSYMMIGLIVLLLLARWL